MIMKRFWDYLGGLNGLLFILYVFVAVTSGFLLNDILCGLMPFLIPLLALLLILICPRILRLAARIRLPEGSGLKGRLEGSVVIKILLYILPFFSFMLYYAAFCPGAFPADPLNQLGQAFSGQYSDWHPVIHTLIAFKLPLALSGGWIGSIVLLQILALSAALGYSFNVILKHTGIKFTFIFLLITLLNPQTSYILMYPIKDNAFACGAILLLAFSLQIFFSKGEWIRKNLNLIILIITAVFTSLVRHNAPLFTIPLFIAIFFYISRKRSIIILVSTVLLCLIIKGPFYSLLGVEKPDKRQVEVLGLPMTVIGGAVRYAPEELDDEILEFAYKVAPEEVWQDYHYGAFNPVKFSCDQDVIEEYGTLKVVTMMFGCFREAPLESWTALIKLTDPVYTLTDNYNANTPYIPPVISRNDYGIECTGNNDLQLILNGYESLAAKFLPHVFMMVSTMHLLLITLALSRFRLAKTGDWKRIIFIIPVLAYNFGTTLLLTSYVDAIRFFSYTYYLMPMLILVMLAGRPGPRDGSIKAYKKDEGGLDD